METEMKLPPNTSYKCIFETYCFTVGKTYKTNSDGLILDDNGDEREVISVQDDFFFERFKVSQPVSEIKINGSTSAKFNTIGYLTINSGTNVVYISTAEAIQLRDFLNQLELTIEKK